MPHQARGVEGLSARTRRYARHKDRVATVFEVNDIVAAAELVRNDLGLCIMPRSVADRFPDLRQYRIRRHAPTWKVMVVRPPGDPSPAVAALLRHLA
ncbi:LysR substrate-binding domain-containing protein [Streptomyces sp. NPDC008125]|uniref:LysR substrate-binding domain-containing protein n=1 Tax=Streptomyces sp. NPDC008125 TaxID=3364811 RepID=UPI0036E1380C